MKNKKQKIAQPKKKDLSKMISSKNFIVGLGVVLLFMLSLGMIQNSQSLNQSEVDIKSPLVEDNTIVTPTMTVTDLSEQESASNSALSVKELPNTQGAIYHTVSANENFWKISKRLCGSGIYYLSIKQYNGYQNRTLRPGDVLTVICAQ